MNKKIPNIYKGTPPANLNQEKSIISTVTTEETFEEEVPKSINSQIKDIFSSSNFVYKADTKITLFSGETLEKTIIGRTNNSLITIDDELIDVKDIERIEVC